MATTPMDPNIPPVGHLAETRDRLNASALPVIHLDYASRILWALEAALGSLDEDYPLNDPVIAAVEKARDLYVQQVKKLDSGVFANGLIG